MRHFEPEVDGEGCLWDDEQGDPGVRSYLGLIRTRSGFGPGFV